MMKIKISITLLFLFPVFSLFAQINTNIDFAIKSAPTKNITINETELDLSLGGKVDSKNTLTNTLTYKNIQVNKKLEDNLINTNDHQYNSFENALELAHFINNKTTLKFEIKPTINFENDFNLKHTTLLGGLEVNHILNANHKISAGIMRSAIFGKFEFLPTFSYYHKINAATFFEVGFPNSKISYSNNIRNVFSITNNFSGNSYNLDIPKTMSDLSLATSASFSQITTAIEFERNMDRNWFLNLKCGYDSNKKYDLRDSQGNTTYNYNINDGLIFNIGIKYKH